MNLLPRYLAICTAALMFVLHASADLFVESVSSTTAGVLTDIDYISTDLTPTAGDFHKVVVLVDDWVVAEESTPSGTLHVTFRQPGTIDYIVRTYSVDGDAIDSVARSINVFGIAVVEPGENELVGLGSRLFLGASAIFEDKLISSVEFQYRASGGGNYSSISGSRDSTSPYAFLYEPPSTGVWEVRAVAHHPDGELTESLPITLQVAASSTRQPSHVTILDPSAGSSVQAGVQRTINVDVSSRTGVIRGVDMFVDGELLNTTAGQDVSFPFAFDWKPPRPGSYALIAIVTDNSGIRVASDEVVVTATDDRPHAELLLPEDGATFVAGKQIPLVAIATGQGGARERVRGVEFLVNGNAILLNATSGVSEDVEAPYSVDWTPEFPGHYSVQARVIDSVTGASYQTPSILLNITEALPPVAAMVQPYQGDFFYTGETVHLSATARDGQGLIRALDFYVNDVNIGAGTASDGTFNLDYLFESPGIYQIHARATSDSHRVAISSSVSITVTFDNGDRPTVSFSSPTSGESFTAGDSIQLVADADDLDGTVASVQFYLDQTPIGDPDTVYPFTFDDYPLTTPGLYRFAAVARDRSGNFSRRAFVEVRATTPSFSRPTISIRNPLNESTFEVGNTLFVEVDAHDSDGSVSEVRFEIDGIALGDPDTSYPFQSTFYTLERPGLYRVVATAYDDEGYMSLPAKSIFYVVPVAEVDGPQFDPLSDNRDFLIQLFVDLFLRGPTDAELNRYLEKLEFGIMSKAQVVEALYATAEFQNLRHSQNAYHALLGEWPSPLEFASALGGIHSSQSTSSPTGEDDVGNTFEQSTPLSSEGEVVTGVLEVTGDVDMFSFQLAEESLVTVYTTGPFDTVGAVYGSDGQVIEYDDDSGSFFNFAVQRVLLPGTYYVSVAGWVGSAGTYTLNLVLGDNIAIPQDSDISDAELDRTVSFIYESSPYENLYGPVQSMESESNRRAHFERLFTNRFGEAPTMQQLLQGANRIDNASTLAGFTSSFIRNDRVGLADFIYHLPDVTSRDDAAFLLRALIKIRPDTGTIAPLLNLSLLEQVESLLGSAQYRARFTATAEVEARIETHSLTLEPSLLIEPLSRWGDPHTRLSNLGKGDPIDALNPFYHLQANDAGWKYVEWLGWISDVHFPMIYHEQMGWIRVNPIQPDELWVWHERLDWSYFAAGAYPMIYRYSDGAWVELVFGNEPGSFEIYPIPPSGQ